MPSGKVKWFNSKKVMVLLPTMKQIKIFFTCFSSGKLKVKSFKRRAKISFDIKEEKK